MKGRLIITLLISGLMACNQNVSHEELIGTNIITIKGAVKYPQDGNIVLEEFESSQNSFTPYDTIPLKADNTYTREVYYDQPGYYRLNFFNKQFVNLIVDGDDMEVNVDGHTMNGAVEIIGSSDIDKLNQLSDVLTEFSRKEAEINKDFTAAATSQDMEKVELIRDQYMDLQEEKIEAIKGEINKMGVSLAAMQAVNLLDKDKEFAFVQDLVMKLKEKYPDLDFVQALYDEIERLKVVAVGQIAPEISLPNPEGEIVSLSSLRGKYVLVDFWAEWCKPCRAENPNIVKAYNRFKDEGFEVFGVSLDRTREKWVSAIKQDGLNWTHVSDLQYFNSAAARTYNINAIPYSVLLDPEGKIIAKNLRGKALHQKLEEVFNR